MKLLNAAIFLKLLQEQQLGVTGAVDPETAAQLGKISPARVTLTARMVRTQTGALDWTATHTQGWHPLKWLCFFSSPGCDFRSAGDYDFSLT